MPLVEPDQVNEIAMFAGRGIDPVTDPAALGLEQTDIETAPGCTGNITDHPVAPLAPSGREVMATDGLRILG